MAPGVWSNYFKPILCGMDLDLHNPQSMDMIAKEVVGLKEVEILKQKDFRI